jgi:hypothetical protein
MFSLKDIYLSAHALIEKYGDEAETVATQKMQTLMDNDDVQGASVWLHIACAIDDLRNAKRQGKLH